MGELTFSTLNIVSAAFGTFDVSCLVVIRKHQS